MSWPSGARKRRRTLPSSGRRGRKARECRAWAGSCQAASLLARPEGPVLLDCKLNAAVAAPFMSEFHEYETRRH